MPTEATTKTAVAARPPVLGDYTVTLAGPERHDGEAPYTYVVSAPDVDAAESLARGVFVRENELDFDWHTGGFQEPDVVVVHGPGDTFAGAPDWPEDEIGRVWNDRREDALVIALALQMAAGFVRTGPVPRGGNRPPRAPGRRDEAEHQTRPGGIRLANKKR